MSQRSCPNQTMLTHFAMGRLDMAGIEEVCEHLEVCSQCAKTLNGLQVSDTLLDALNHRSGGQPSAEPVLRELLSRVQALGVTPDSEVDDVPLAARLACLRPRETADELGRLGPYRILQVIGVGGMGTVFLAEHLEHQGRVALKVMRPGLSDSASGRNRKYSGRISRQMHTVWWSMIAKTAICIFRELKQPPLT